MCVRTGSILVLRIEYQLTCDSIISMHIHTVLTRLKKLTQGNRATMAYILTIYIIYMIVFHIGFLKRFKVYKCE